MSDPAKHYTVMVPCSHRPGTFHVHPIGEVDPKEMVCAHIFVLDLGSDGIRCTGCGLFIAGMMLERLKWETRRFLSERERGLADENTRLLDENREVLAENSRLRRKLEAAERKR